MLQPAHNSRGNHSAAVEIKLNQQQKDCKDMTQKETGGQAYPTKHGYLGMTLRDYFAGQALAETVADSSGPKQASKTAYMIADAMIAARDAK